MNLTQLSTWFANARRRIKKIGMKVWLEGRSTFTVDFFPSPTARPSMTADSGYTSGGKEELWACTLPPSCTFVCLLFSCLSVVQACAASVSKLIGLRQFIVDSIVPLHYFIPLDCEC